MVYGTEQEWSNVMKANLLGRPSLSFAILTFCNGPACNSKGHFLLIALLAQSIISITKPLVKEYPKVLKYWDT